MRKVKFQDGLNEKDRLGNTQENGDGRCSTEDANCENSFCDSQEDNFDNRTESEKIYGGSKEDR